MEPLGFHWRASVAALAGVPAKEIVVSTLGVLYSVEDADHDSATLSEKLVTSRNYTPAAALAMMIFVMLYFPCVATIAAIAHEAGGWRWAAFSVVYNTLVAWFMAWAVYHLATMLGL